MGGQLPVHESAVWIKLIQMNIYILIYRHLGTTCTYKYTTSIRLGAWDLEDLDLPLLLVAVRPALHPQVEAVVRVVAVHGVVLVEAGHEM